MDKLSSILGGKYKGGIISGSQDFMRETGAVRIVADIRRYPYRYLAIEAHQKFTPEQLDKIVGHIKEYEITIDHLGFDDFSPNGEAYDQLKDAYPQLWNQSDFAQRYTQSHTEVKKKLIADVGEFINKKF